MIAIAILVSSFLPFLVVDTPSVSQPIQKSRAMSITGNTYGGSGNFVITQETVYDGTNLHVYGNIYINSGSLTIRHATLTMDESSQYQNSIYVNWSESDRALKLKYAYLTVTNSSDNGTPMLKILPAASCNVYISNSTVNHTWIQTNDGTNAWIDNTTAHASRFYGIYGQSSGSLNISTNTWRDYAGWGMITNSVAGAVFSTNTFTNISQVEDPGFNYRGMITVYGNGYTGNITIIKNHFDKVEIQGIKVQAAWSVRISYNTFDNLTSTLLGAGATEGITAWGDGKHPALTPYSYIDHNTIEDIMGDPSYFGATGISLTENAKHWYVTDNTVWNILKPSGGYESVGIGVGGGTVAGGTSLIYLERNHFGNVSGDFDTPGGQPKAISVKGTGSISGPFTTTNILVDRNTIDLVKNSSLGIEVRYMVSDTKVSNNTITLLRGYDSSGIGVYNEPRRIVISDNAITMWRDVWGINLAHNHTYVTVARNTIHVLAQAHFHDEGVDALWRGGGAIAIDDEDPTIYLALELHWTAVGDIISNNHIIQDDTTEYFPEYTILNCYRQITIGDPGPWPQIFLDQDAMIYSYHSNFTVWWNRGTDATIVDNFGTSYDKVASSGYWRADGFTLTTDFYFINVTLGIPMPASVSNIIGITFLMFGIGIVVGVVAEGTNSLRKMQMRTTEQMMKSLLNMVIYIVIGMASLGVMYSMV